jgi:hypothetical protein
MSINTQLERHPMGKILRRLAGTVTAIGATTAITMGCVTPASADVIGEYFYSVKALSEGREMLQELDSIGWPEEQTYNWYVSGSTDVVWGTEGSPTTYRSKAACAPYVSQLLRHTYPEWATDAYFTQEFASQSPNSAKYYEKLKADTLDHFDRVNGIGNVSVGNILAIKYNDSSSESGDVSGHTAVVASTPQPYDKDNDPHTTEYIFKVLDSTSSPHGVASVSPSSPYLDYPDTRAEGTTEYKGLGEGYMVVRVHPVLGIVGYWWGVNENLTDQYHSISDRPMVFGRITSNV